ncbi:hypothetical protein FCH79_26690 [Pseudomonas koreensis]|nr:hypothetical protein [Pseudomonas koreensis]
MLCLVSCAQEIAKTVENIVGASLLAKAVCQTTAMLNVSQHSRAGSLPHFLQRFDVDDLDVKGQRLA